VSFFVFDFIVVKLPKQIIC